MTNTDNNLRAETILLAHKALDVLNKVLDLLAADEAQASHCSTQESPTEATVSQGATQTAQPDSHRTNANRFNEQYLTDHNDLRNDTMLKATEPHTKSTEIAEKAAVTASIACSATPVASEDAADPRRPVTGRDHNTQPVYDSRHGKLTAPAARALTHRKERPLLLRCRPLAMVAQAYGRSPQSHLREPQHTAVNRRHRVHTLRCAMPAGQALCGAARGGPATARREQLGSKARAGAGGSFR